jgi:hypothetical protein
MAACGHVADYGAVVQSHVSTSNHLAKADHVDGNPRRPHVTPWLVSHMAQWQHGQCGHVAKCTFCNVVTCTFCNNLICHTVSMSLVTRG